MKEVIKVMCIVLTVAGALVAGKIIFEMYDSLVRKNYYDVD